MYWVWLFLKRIEDYRTGLKQVRGISVLTLKREENRDVSDVIVLSRDIWTWIKWGMDKSTKYRINRG